MLMRVKGGKTSENLGGTMGQQARGACSANASLARAEPEQSTRLLMQVTV